jgi:hypothetical protein
MLGGHHILEHCQPIVFHRMTGWIHDDHSDGFIGQGVPYDVFACPLWIGHLPLRCADPRLETSLWDAALEFAHHGLACLLEAFIQRSVELENAVVSGLSAPAQHLVKSIRLLLREPHETATLLVQNEAHHAVQLLWRSATVLGIAC